MAEAVHTDFVAVTTVRDHGAAEVVATTLSEHQIPVELKRVGLNPYLGMLTTIEIEVRVPAERLAEAEGVLDHFSVEAEQAAMAEAPRPSGVGGADDAEAEARARLVREAGPVPRIKSRALGAVLALALPLVGPLYAAAPGVALASLLVHLPLFYWMAASDRADPRLALIAWALGRLIDVAGTQQALRRHNQLVRAARADAKADSVKDQSARPVMEPAPDRSSGATDSIPDANAKEPDHGPHS